MAVVDHDTVAPVVRRSAAAALIVVLVLAVLSAAAGALGEGGIERDDEHLAVFEHDSQFAEGSRETDETDEGADPVPLLVAGVVVVVLIVTLFVVRRRRPAP